MNIWITEQVVIVIHLHALCRGCKVFCLEPVVLLSTGFLTGCLKWGRGEWEHRCYWVALLPRKNDLCLQMPPLSVFGASCYAPVPSSLSGYHAGIKTCHLPRWQTAGVPPPHTLYVSEVLPPWVSLRCSFGPYACLEIKKERKKETRAERWASAQPRTTKVNRRIKTSDLPAALLL